MRKILLTLSVVTATLFYHVLLASEPKDGNYLVFPVKTDLQRLLLSWRGDTKDSKAVVLVNGSAIVKGSTIDSSALDLAALRKELSPYSDRENGTVHFDIRFGQSISGFDRKASGMLMWALEGFGRNAGFRNSIVTLGGYFEWEETTRSINEKGNQHDGDEDGVGNDLLKVYPTRTLLTRYLTSNADCVVDIFEPLEREGQFTNDPRIRDAVQGYLQKVKPSHWDGIYFRIRGNNASKEVSNKFIEVESKVLADSLGFKKKYVSSVPK